MTLVLITLALVLFFALRGRRVKARDAAAEAARRAVEARLESGAAAQRDDDSDGACRLVSGRFLPLFISAGTFSTWPPNPRRPFRT